MERELKRVVQTVNRLALLYWGLGSEKREQIRSLSENWREAFKWFLGSFAFERQGRSPRYSSTAVKAVELYKGDVPGPDFERQLWHNFLESGGFPSDGKGANPKNNPLYPSDNKLRTASYLVNSLGDFDFNIVRWAVFLVQSGGLERAWSELKSIRGIGNKIASLYLRDIVEAFEIDEDRAGNKIYLQPIDVWTRRGAEALSEYLSMAPKSDGECAQILVQVSEDAGVRSTLTNTGLWILGAQLISDSVRFNGLLLNIDDLLDFISKRMYWHQEYAKILKNVLNASDDG